MEPNRSLSSVRLAAFLCLIVIPVGAAAQSSSSIAGMVKDSTGAVLPGVTVEAASPVLIEKVRSAVTDGSGQYKIVDLRPGTYTVTFSLVGFSTIQREGIQLSAAFAATVNADLTVGSMEETITVSGFSPTVDTQNVVQQSVVTREIMDAVPAARNWEGLAQVIPGMSQSPVARASGQDVGGSSGDRGKLMIHGGRETDQIQLMDGLSWQQIDSGGSSSHYTANPGEAQEYSYQLGSHSAQTAYGGVLVNVIPREGGNPARDLRAGSVDPEAPDD